MAAGRGHRNAASRGMQDPAGLIARCLLAAKTAVAPGASVGIGNPLMAVGRDDMTSATDVVLPVTLFGPGGVPSHVRDEIVASWRRSAASGLRPDHLQVPFDPDVDRDGLLVQAALPVLRQLAADLSGAPVAILLADERGQVLDRRVPDASLSARLDRIFLAPGFLYAEDLVGTNGIGTALVQRSAAAVVGDEHFADALVMAACAAAPISDPRHGRILGVIGLTSLVEDAGPLMLPLARRAAREIEQRLVDATGVSRTRP